MYKFILFVFSLFLVSGEARAATEEVQPFERYCSRGGNRCFDTLAEAITDQEKYHCDMGWTGCRITISGPPYWGYNLWQQATLPYRVTATSSSGSVLDQNNSLRIKFYCPVGWSNWYDSTIPAQRCTRTEPVKCDICNAKRNEFVPVVGNPIIVYTLEKMESAQDYANPSGTLNFTRTYRSGSGRWLHNHERSGIDYASLAWIGKANDCFYDAMTTPPRCYPYMRTRVDFSYEVRRGHQGAIRFSSPSGWDPSKDVDDRIWPNKDEAGVTVSWTVFNAGEQSFEVYGMNGLLQSITTLAGHKTSYTYSIPGTPANIAPMPGLLIRITDAFDRSLHLAYDELGRLAKLTDPDGRETTYGYDTTGNLTSVRYPDGRTRQYLYNEIEHIIGTGYKGSGALTGIIDENGIRYATFKYKSTGVAYSTEHAGGVGKYTVNAIDNVARNVVDPLGTTRSYRASNQAAINTRKHMSETRPGVNGGTVSDYHQYDAQGNVKSIRDFAGTTTLFEYDLSRNLETKKTEASGTTLARITSTQWHPSLRLPTKIAAPKLMTTMAYDDKGRLLERTEQATSDATGAQQFTASLQGRPRTWKYTYNDIGQVLTTTEPGPGAPAVTTYEYDTSGNLKTITNALGHVTTLSQYDQSGRVGKLQMPNGLTREFAYHLRGWLSRETVTFDGVTEETIYEHDGVGQLTKVNNPDGSFIKFDYDDAHRLIKVTDSANNAIHYNLDNAGNKLSEKTLDASGNLTRQVSRIFDNLNRMKSITGGAQ
jgi:YD repeat-containing protein